MGRGDSSFQLLFCPVYPVTFEIRENATVSAAILFPAVCVRNVITAANMAKISNISRVERFLLFTGRERTNMSAPWGAQIRIKMFCLCPCLCSSLCLSLSLPDSLSLCLCLCLSLCVSLSLSFSLSLSASLSQPLSVSVFFSLSLSLSVSLSLFLSASLCLSVSVSLCLSL